MEPDTLPKGVTAMVNCAPADKRAEFRVARRNRDSAAVRGARIRLGYP